jgi:radical SAM protein with 4Fe4S-binding SPASM domain
MGVSSVVLSGGEPLMHSDLFALSTPLREAGIAITLLSSGLLLARNAEAIARSVDEVLVSLDGPREIHDAIRSVPRAFDRLADGVAALKTRHPSFPVSGRCTVQRKNAPHLLSTVEAARAIGLDRISFLAVDVASDAFNRPRGGGETPAAELLPSAVELQALEAGLGALERDNARDFASGFIAESPEKLRRTLLDHFRALAAGRAPEGAPCNAPWVSAVVESDGTVRPCFFHPPLGNIREAGSLESVLNGERALAFRRSLDVLTDPVCVRCVCRLNLRESEVPRREEALRGG